MPDRAQSLRLEAARCLAQARLTADPLRRAELINMAARFHELAGSLASDFDAILQAFNDAKMAPTAPPASEPAAPVVQQQQQIQPEKKNE
jgi:hypothetical protein